MNQRTVYVRPYTPETDDGLVRSMADRDVWVVEPDAQPYRMFRIASQSLAIEELEAGAGQRNPISKTRLTHDLLNLSQHKGAAVIP